MSYLVSKRDVITTTPRTLHIKNEFGNTFGAQLQTDGKLCIQANQGGNNISLRLNEIEVQHLRETLNVR